MSQTSISGPSFRTWQLRSCKSWTGFMQQYIYIYTNSHKRVQLHAGGDGGEGEGEGEAGGEAEETGREGGRGPAGFLMEATQFWDARGFLTI